MWSGGHMYPATMCTSSVGKSDVLWCCLWYVHLHPHLIVSVIFGLASSYHHYFLLSYDMSQAKLRDAAALIQEWCSILHKISLFCNIVSNTPFGSYSKRQTDWTIFWLHILHIFTTREAFSMYTPCDQIYMRGKRNGKGWRRGRQALEFSSNLSTTSQHFWEVHNP